MVRQVSGQRKPTVWSSCAFAGIGLLLGSNELVEQFVHASDLLLGDLGQLHDLAERTWNIIATAGEEDTAGDHGVLALALEQAALFGIFVQVLRAVRDSARQLPALAQSADVLVGLQQTLVAFVKVRLVLGAVQVLGPHTTIAEGNVGVQLRAVQQSVGSVTDTTWVIVALVVV